MPVETLSTVTTLASTLAAFIAAFAALKSVSSWKKQARFESKRDAINTWVSGAVLFRGRLKFIYKSDVKWPEDKAEIELISEHFWNWNSTWPYAKASLDGELEKEAFILWNNVYLSYSSVMEGKANINTLGLAVEAVYNSSIIKSIITKES
ncbi:MAG TPA: hypothetical protein VJY83_08475 [Thiopseudomonas sp.]|nr:hypothetical protein [Thiopseudomonas sp.]